MICMCALQDAGPVDLYKPTMSNAIVTSAAVTSLLAAGIGSPSAAFSSMLTKFGLASICGKLLIMAPSWDSAPCQHQSCETQYCDVQKKLLMRHNARCISTLR